MNNPPNNPAPESFAGQDSLVSPPTTTLGNLSNARVKPAAVLGLMMFLMPALGVPSELMIQDTLKSAVASFGVLAAALLFFWQQRQRSAPLLWHGLMYLPLLLMVYALGSMAWSHTYLAGVEAIRWFVLSLLLWLGLNTLTRENLPILVWGLFAGALAASGWAALQFWLDLGLFPQVAGPASTFVNRNFFAEYAVCALPFSVYVLANMRQSRWLGLVALAVALNVVAILMTGTRSALLTMGVLSPVFAVILYRYRQQFAFHHWHRAQQVLVGLLLIAGVLGLGSIPTGNPKLIQENTGTTALQRSFVRTASMTEGKEYTEGSFSIRATMWKATARMVMANPLTGVGAGAWEVQIPLYQRGNISQETDFYAHNEILQLLSEYGVVVGGLFLAVLFAYLLLAAGKTWRLQGADLQEAPLRAITLASLLALLMVSNAGFPWHLASCGILMSLCLAILAASDARLGHQEVFFASRLPWRPRFSHAMLGFVMCCTLLAGYLTQQATEAEFKTVHAIKMAYQIDQSSADQKAEMLQSIRDGITINSHNRRLTPMMADLLAAHGDWKNAVWIWESVAASRPNIADLWANIALAHTHLQQGDQAQAALQELQRLLPNTPRMRAMEILVLSRTGHEAQATQKLNDYFDQGLHEHDLVQFAYAFGLETQRWPLAIRGLKLGIQYWPKQSAEAYLRLGKIYADPRVHDEAKAIAAFRAGLRSTPLEQQNDFRQQVPEKYRSQI